MEYTAGYREGWVLSVHPEWTRFGLCSIGHGFPEVRESSPEVLIVVENTIRCLLGTIFIAVIHCVFLDVLKLQSEGMKGAAWGLASRWWGTMVATPCSQRLNCRSLLLCSFLNQTFIHSLWTSFIWKERCRVAPGPWSPSPPSCRWSRPWGTQWSRGSIPTLPFPRTLLWRNEPWTEGAWLGNGLSEFGDLLISGEFALD